MDVPLDFVRGTFVEESAHPVPRALSPRTQPPRQEQRSALRPCSASARSATWHPLWRTPWRLTPVLQPRRMNILTIRGVTPATRRARITSFAGNHLFLNRRRGSGIHRLRLRLPLRFRCDWSPAPRKPEEAKPAAVLA